MSGRLPTWRADPPHPIDWDHQTYCTHPRCTRPATHQRLIAMHHQHPIYELVCCQHATQDTL